MHAKWFYAILMATAFSGLAAMTVVAAPPSNSPGSPALQATTTSTPTLVGTPSVTSTITATATTTSTLSLGNDKIAHAIADYFGVGFDEVLDIHEQAHGWGQVFFVFALAKQTGESPDEIWAMFEAGQGWGQIVMGLGLKPGNKRNNLGAAVLGKPTPTLAPTGSSLNNAPKSNDAGSDCKGNPNNKGKGNPCNSPGATPAPSSNQNGNSSNGNSGNGNGKGKGH